MAKIKDMKDKVMGIIIPPSRDMVGCREVVVRVGVREVEEIPQEELIITPVRVVSTNAVWVD